MGVAITTLYKKKWASFRKRLQENWSSENKSTPYSWQFESDDNLSLLSDNYEPNKSNRKRPLIGTGGIRTLVFEAKSEGLAFLEFALANHWVDAFAPGNDQ